MIMHRSFGFTVLHRDKKTRARTGVIHTPHGDIQTPAFVPVGTQASVKSLTPDELTALGVELFFVNTYHMYLRPGIDVVKKFGGLHKFMDWNNPLITDSGGFQVFSLARGDTESSRPNLVKITDEGVEFRSHWDGSRHLFAPESSMEWQWQLGADIHIAFDDCTPYPVTHQQARLSMERTHRWASRCVAANAKCQMLHAKLGKPYQALYGSVQGSIYEDLRKESAEFIASLGFDGYAIGGVSVGENKREMTQVVSWVVPFLKEEKPRHLLGVGEIEDIFMLAEHGIDTFDCVQATRLARAGQLYITTKVKGKHEIDITKKVFSNDMKPIDEKCSCYACSHFSRAYIHHLFRVRELLAYRLASIHNICFVNQLVNTIRQAIARGSLLELKRQWLVQ